MTGILDRTKKTALLVLRERSIYLWLSLLMCLMFTLWGASPLGVISNVSPLGVISNASPLGVPADLQSADKKGSTSLSGICNPQP